MYVVEVSVNVCDESEGGICAGSEGEGGGGGVVGYRTVDQGLHKREHSRVGWSEGGQP